MVTRWAILGTGGMAHAMVQDFKLTPKIELKAIVSRTQIRAEAVANQWGIAEGSSDYHSILNRNDIDAIYIATPHMFHFEQAQLALAAGKHVLVEKPITMNAGQAYELKAIAKKSGRFLMEAMWMSFSPAIIEAKRIIKSGKIGIANFVEASFGVVFDFDADKIESSRIWNKKLGGSALLDIGVYPISLAQSLFGKPVESHVRGNIGDTGIDVEATMVLEFAGGERAALTASMRTNTLLNATIGGSSGLIEIASPFWNSPGIRVLTRDSKTQQTLTRESMKFEQEGNGYVPMLRAVNEAISTGAQEHPLQRIDDTISVMETVDGLLADIQRTNSNR